MIMFDDFIFCYKQKIFLSRTWTDNLRVNSSTLYQLSYQETANEKGLEPLTCDFEDQCSTNWATRSLCVFKLCYNF